MEVKTWVGMGTGKDGLCNNHRNTWDGTEVPCI